MLEFIGMLIGLFVVSCLAFLLSLIIGASAWLLFLRRRRPKKLILMAASIPPLSLGYLIVCAVIFTIFVPNQPDLFFGDFSEPLANGYVLKGLAKMPEYAFLDVEGHGKNQPGISGIKSLEQDGEVVFGAYSHPEYGSPAFFAAPGINYFKFDTKSGQVCNFKTIQELNSSAGHPVHLVESEFFRSQNPSRILLRRIENTILYLPPAAIFVFLAYQVLRARFQSAGRDAEKAPHSAGLSPL